jgi:CubicO group peptidase (beta-lactamase class C family)
MLLTHRAGWDGDALFAVPGDPVLSSVPGRIRGFRRIFAPGENWSYNNAAFSLAGCLVEALAGEPYAAALRRLVLDPVGISHAFTTADEVVTHRVAVPHAVLGDDAIVLRGFGWQPGWELSDLDVPAGGISTCVPALLRWGAVALGEIDGPLDDTHRRMMQERRHPAGGNTDAMGIGWLHADLGGIATFGHDGMTVGYLSGLVIVPSADLVIVVLTNALHGSALCTSVRDQVLQSLAGAGAILPEVPADPPAGVAAELVGSYDDPFYVVHLQPGDGPERLVVAPEPRSPEPGRWTPPALGEPIPLAWIGPDRWMTLEPEGGGAFLDVGRGAGGEVTWIRRGARICHRS